MLVKEEWLRKAGVEEVLIEGVDLLKKVRELKARDDEVIKAVEEMKRAGVKMLRDEEWREEDGLMLKEGKVYVPKDEELRTEIRNKNQTTAPVGKLMPNEAPKKPWTHITVDFITKLPLAQGYNAILVVCDRLTKMAHFVPTMEKTSAEGLARLFRDHV